MFKFFLAVLALLILSSCVSYQYDDVESSLLYLEADRFFSEESIAETYLYAEQLYDKPETIREVVNLFYLGKLYEEGVGRPVNYRKAMDLYRRAADEGFPKAYNEIGNLYRFGLGVEQDYNQALAWYLKAAEMNHDFALYNLGVFYEEGYGVDVDYARAFEFFQRSAALNNKFAYNQLGEFYRRGLVSTDFETAFRMYEKSFALGYEGAEDNLALMYLMGWGVPVNYMKAYDIFSKNADTSEFAREYLEKMNKLYVNMALNGSLEQKHRLGWMYWKGKGAEKNPTAAFALISEASALGTCDVVNDLGALYWLGVGTEQDFEKAVALFRQAIDKDENCLTAKSDLGIALITGSGVRQDVGRGLELLNSAAEAGLARAQFLLAYYHFHGIYRVPIDDELARKWLAKAVENAYENQDAMNKLMEEMKKSGSI